MPEQKKLPVTGLEVAPNASPEIGTTTSNSPGSKNNWIEEWNRTVGQNFQQPVIPLKNQEFFDAVVSMVACPDMWNGESESFLQGLGGVMRALLGISIAVALATTAGATLDPEPNSIGVYFDQGALTNSIEVEPWDPEGDTSGVFEAYIILTNMTEPIIEGFVVSFRIVYPPEMEDRVFLLDFRFGWPTPGGFYFIEPFADDISIGIAYPQYAEPVKVLVVWTLVILDDTWVEFYIGHPQEYGGGNAIAYYVGPQVNVVPFNFSTGNPDLPAARVNGPAPVTTRTTTFGSVKALYR